MPRKPALQKLTLFLLKETMSRDDVLRGRDFDSTHVVPAIDPDEDSLFVSSTRPHAPSWTKYLDGQVHGDLDSLLTASCGAVLLFEAGGRLFAATFGQGRHLLDPDAWEQDFGLKVVLNTVSPGQLKSIDAKTIDETTLHTRRDVSRDSSLSAFGLDVSRDLLRSVTGTPEDDTLAHRVAGSDALGVWTRARIPDLPALAERLLAAYGSDVYKKNFDFIDYLRPEKRAGRLRQLEQELVDALNHREITDLHLAVPETVDWLDIDGFRFSTQRRDTGPDSDPRISAYLDTREGQDLNLDRLKQDRLIAVRASDGQFYRHWTIFKSLVYEVEVDGELYALSAGEWFRVELDFKKLVYDFVDGLDQIDTLPDAESQTNEDDYNISAAEAIGGLCLDRKFVYDGGPDKMEICDVLTRDGGMIHVKQRGSSSTLSHLFTQGLNSAERLMQDEDYRAKARDVIAGEDAAFAEVLPAARPEDPSKYEVTFAVITRSTRPTPLTLPFFSLVSLRAATIRLRALGFRVSIAEIHEAS